MSIGLILYIINKRDFNEEKLCPTHILYIGKTNLVDYFVDGDGAKYIKTVEENKKLYVLSCDSEMPNIVDEDPYSNKFKYILSSQFSLIPKSILKEENKVVKAAVKFIKKIPESIVILYYT
jgi:hypothetical protein